MKKIYNIKVSTWLLILLPILSILIGYFGVKLYLLSNNNFNDAIDLNQPGVEEIMENDDKEPEEPLIESETNEDNEKESDTVNTNKKITNQIKNISFYSVQVGSFSNKENAEQFKNELLQKGYYSYQLEKQNFTVFVGTSYNKDDLQDELDDIKSFSPDAFVKRIDLESRNFSYVIDKKDYFIEMSELIADQINNANETLDIKTIEDNLDQIEEINSLFIEIDDQNKTVGKLITNYVADLRKDIEIINSNDEEKLSLLLEKNIKSFVKNFR